MRWTALLLAAITSAAPTLGEEQTTAHAKVVYSGIDAAQAKALAQTIEAAWKVYGEQFKFEMPDTIQLNVDCGPGRRTQLYTDGENRVFLTMPSKDVLARPATSGTFNLYGICHELGHIVMYRTLKKRDWLKGGAAEDWAHYAGSTVVDAVYAAEGPDLWPDKYDYRQDGMARLKGQLAAQKSDAFAATSGQWLALEGIIGKSGFVELFTAWNDTELDTTKAAEAVKLQQAAVKLWPDKSAALTKWWQAASPLLVEMRAASAIKPETTVPTRLTGRPITLKYDDGTKDGQRSIAGGGHARRFIAPDEDWYLRSVSVLGSRYGSPQASGDFDIALCDGSMRIIATWKKPYGSFQRGEFKWARLDIPPTRVPKEFYVCLDFNPTAARGIYVASDNSTKGGSQVATPGKAGSTLEGSDWMMRVDLDKLKTAASKPPAK